MKSFRKCRHIDPSQILLRLTSLEMYEILIIKGSCCKNIIQSMANRKTNFGFFMYTNKPNDKIRPNSILM